MMCKKYDLTNVENPADLKKLIAAYGLTYGDIAKRAGYAEATVYYMMTGQKSTRSENYMIIRRAIFNMMEERDDEKAEEIRRRYLEEKAKKKEEKCHYCDTEEDKDIFFNFLPAMFGIEKENHDYNQDVTVFITDNSELELCVMMGDDYLLKEKKKIKYCPFCGRRLHND